MKTNLFLLGMAVAAFSSCTNEEVTDVAQNRAIKFNQFVNNNTRTVVEVNKDNLQNYYVFGESGNVEGTYGIKNFNNELQTTPYYWIADKFYSFGAYADGNSGKIEGATFNANDGKLTFTNYTPDDAKDLVAAVTKMQCNSDASQQDAVDLTFKHMLSQVKFTFNTTDGEEYQIEISKLKINAVKTSTGNIALSESNKVTINWENTSATKEDYDMYPVISDVANENKTASSESKLVIPQDRTDLLKVTFTASITGAGLNEKADFEATLAVDENIAGISEANTWMPGYRYNYTATINGDNIKPDLGQQKIKFTVSVDPWKDATSDQPVNPTQPVVP